MARFIENNLICRYGVPHHIVTDNGVQFQVKVRDLLQRYGIDCEAGQITYPSL